MIKLISFGSSSKGNCHILYNGVSSLMLDCGVNMKRHNYDVQKYNIVGILISHEHLDHCRGLKDKSYLGNQNVYSNKETLDFLGDSVMNYRKFPLDEMKPQKIGEHWIVVPIHVAHDVECYGYIIKDKLSGMKIAYFTDLGFSENLKIGGINIWIIECNHIRSEIESKLEVSIDENDNSSAYFRRVLGNKGHLSMEDSCQLINNNYGYGLKCILLCHISHSESDFKRYEDLYQSKLKLLGLDLECAKVHAINNHIVDFEEYKIIPKNEWEDMELD